ncbi:MAG: GHKL domain-containing protein [Clostridiales bacterium]|jgi:two-component system sensor histidine kinase AgrC|nr:GHKL domain-containing protein [Eubacteriales bacterium]MDH7565983.1 GHKL domain-containing protein [Clostridiales bacterium]
MGIDIFLLNLFFNFFIGIALVILAHTIYNIKFKIKEIIIFSTSLVIIFNTIAYFFKFLPSWINIVKPVILFIIALLLAVLILRLDIKKSIISYGLVTIIYAISESITFLVFKLLKVDAMTIVSSNNFFIQLLAQGVLNAISYIIIVIIIFFKLYRSIFFNMRISLMYILITFLAAIITMSYYYLSAKNNLNTLSFVFIAALMVFYSVFMMISINAFYKLGVKEKELEQQKFYNEALDKSLDNLRRFKHGYNNNLSILYMHLKLGNYDKMLSYFDEMLEMNNRLNDTAALNIKNAGLYGIISSKIAYAEEKNVKFKIDPLSSVGEISNIKVTELCEIVGIFLDNAIEAAAESDDRSVAFYAGESDESVVISIKNTFREVPDTKKIYEKGFSSKGEDRGLGLWIVKNILKGNNHVLHNTSIRDNMFIQELVINKK